MKMFSKILVGGLLAALVAGVGYADTTNVFTNVVGQVITTVRDEDGIVLSQTVVFPNQVPPTNATPENAQAKLQDESIAASANVTNGQAVTLSGFILPLASVGGADNGTNTITFANVAAADVGRVYMIVNTGTTNNLKVAQTGNFKSPAIDIAPGGGAIVWATATDALRGIQ